MITSNFYQLYSFDKHQFRYYDKKERRRNFMFPYILPKSIRGKIITCTAVVTLTITAVIVTICFLVFQSFLHKNQLQSAEYNLEVISNHVSADMEKILYFNQWCYSSSDINHYLDIFRKQDKMPAISSENAALRITALNTYERLKEEYHTHFSNYITRVVISPISRRNYLQISNTSSNISAVADVLYQCDFFVPLFQANDYLWLELLEDPILPNKNNLILPIVRPIYNQFNSEIIGWVYFSISDQIFLDYLKSFPLEEDSYLFITIGEHHYQVLDNQLQKTSLSYKIQSDISSQTFNPESLAYQIKLADGQQRIIVTCPLGKEGWNISQILSKQSYYAQRQTYMFIIIGIVIVISFMGIILYGLLNHIINQKVNKLGQKIDAISNGDFSREPSIEWKDELGAIGTGINQMSKKLVSLMNKKVEDEKQKKDLEYQILQNQINPHFLYNTLNSIKWMATIQNASGIAEMTTALARLMKNVSKGTTALIPFREELELVKDYFLIQQYRYGGSISMEYQIDSVDLYECLIHRFTLQPIVENALFHGIEPKGCAGKILIHAQKDFTNLECPIISISITDNGIGMTSEMIEKVLKGDTTPTADFFRHVGISNVNKRIQYEFGTSYGITIESTAGEYTTMQITLPYKTTQEEIL